MSTTRAEAAATTLRARIAFLDSTLNESDGRVRAYYAEIKRLRSALTMIAEGGTWQDDKEIAREALEDR